MGQPNIRRNAAIWINRLSQFAGVSGAPVHTVCIRRSKLLLVGILADDVPCAIKAIFAGALSAQNAILILAPQARETIPVTTLLSLTA